MFYLLKKKSLLLLFGSCKDLYQLKCTINMLQYVLTHTQAKNLNLKKNTPLKVLKKLLANYKFSSQSG